MKLSPGKIPIDILKEVVFKNLGAKRKEVVVGPSVGIDGAVLDVGDKSLIVSMDPITGAVERIGWLAVNVNANDVATFGVEPAFLFSCILLPEKAERKLVEIISTQINAAAKNLGIAIIGGHCESTPSLSNPIVVGGTMGLTEKGCYVTAGGAKPRDKLILTKTAGIEGTAILATDREQSLKRSMSRAMLQVAKNFYSQISVVEDEGGNKGLAVEKAAKKILKRIMKKNPKPRYIISKNILLDYIKLLIPTRVLDFLLIKLFKMDYGTKK